MISKSLVCGGLCRGWAGLDAQVAEQGGHVGSEVFVVLVDGGQPGRDVVVPADLDAGQDRGDDMVPGGEQRRYGPGGRAGQVGAAGRRGGVSPGRAAGAAWEPRGRAGARWLVLWGSASNRRTRAPLV